ncbi:MAG: hypothetical protein U1D69_04675 [Polynucleobacter sp.]|nr:hypothetical protein [Polynucleobacter sp.]
MQNVRAQRAAVRQRAGVIAFRQGVAIGSIVAAAGARPNCAIGLYGAADSPKAGAGGRGLSISGGADEARWLRSFEWALRAYHLHPETKL